MSKEMRIIEKACHDIHMAIKSGVFSKHEMEFMRNFFTALAESATKSLERGPMGGGMYSGKDTQEDS